MAGPPFPTFDTHVLLNRDELQAAWERTRAEILAAWFADYPGTRPLGWWLIDSVALGPRLTVRRKPPTYILPAGQRDAGPTHVCEPEVLYLVRHTQLGSAELADYQHNTRCHNEAPYLSNDIRSALNSYGRAATRDARLQGFAVSPLGPSRGRNTI